MNYSVKPEEHELREAKEVVERIVESCHYVLEKHEDFTVSLGHLGEDEAGDFGVLGEAQSAESAMIYFNPSIEGWKDNLENMVADVYGQTWFLEHSEANFRWQQLLASITGLMVIEELFDPREIEKEDFKKEWAEKKTDLSEEILAGPKANLSWELKALIGRKLLEENDLEELPDLNRTDVLEAGDSLFS